MNISVHIRAARALLDEMKKHAYSREETLQKAVALAELLLLEAGVQTNFQEREEQRELARLMEDNFGKYFIICMTDQCFRSSNPRRVVSQLKFNLDIYGIPKLSGTYLVSIIFIVA